MSEPKITRRKLADYQNDPRNANIGSPRGLGVIEDSLNYSGVGRSLVADKNGVLIAGNKTSDAAAIAGIEDVIEIETDGNALIVHKRRDLDLAHDARAKALAVADNRASELSLTWDNEQLAELLTEIKNEDENLLKASGYYDNELDNLLQSLEQPSSDEWGAALGGLATGDRAPFQQMTFTLHDDQAETVKQAINRAKDMGSFGNTANENSNGNALARVCELFLGMPEHER